jgi:hypothetical protein
MSIDVNRSDRRDIVPRGRPAFRNLHPFVYVGLGVGVMWFALAVWGFSGEGYADYLLAIVSGFMLMAVAIPCILWHVGKVQDARGSAHENDAAHVPHGSFRDWSSADFVTWQGRLPGSNAAIEVLLPIAVTALGMTVFAIIFHIAAHNPIHLS